MEFLGLKDGKVKILALITIRLTVSDHLLLAGAKRRIQLAVASRRLTRHPVLVYTTPHTQRMVPRRTVRVTASVLPFSSLSWKHMVTTFQFSWRPKAQQPEKKL